MIKKLARHEFEKLTIEEKIQYALSRKMGYYEFYGVRPMRRGWKFWESYTDKHHKEAYCPVCRRYTQIVYINWMNWISFYNKMTYYERCEYCLVKLPIIDKTIQRILGFNDKPKELPKGQTVLL